MGRFLIINLLILIIQLSLVKAGLKYPYATSFDNTLLLKNSASHAYCLTQNEQYDCNFLLIEKLNSLYQKSVFTNKNSLVVYSLRVEKFIAKQSGLSPPFSYLKIA